MRSTQEGQAAAPPQPAASAESLRAEEEILRALRRIMQAIDQHSRRLQEEYGLTGPQLMTLRELGTRGTMTATQLARAVHLSGPTMTGILRRLENRTLLVRTRGGADKRQVHVALTEAGRSVLRRAPPPLQVTFREGLQRLGGDDQARILEVLLHVASMMQAGPLTAGPVPAGDMVEPAALGTA